MSTCPSQMLRRDGSSIARPSESTLDQDNICAGVNRLRTPYCHLLVKRDHCRHIIQLVICVTVIS